MKVIYTGHKPKISIALPPGCKFKSQAVETITFVQNDPVEIKDEWAEALCKMDANFKMSTEQGKLKKRKLKYDENFSSEIEKKLEVNI